MPNHTLEEQQQLYALLGNRTVTEFAQLEPAQQREVYRAHLLQRDAILNMQDVGPGFSEMPDGTMLLQEYYMGYDDNGKQLVTASRKFFYRENIFTVPAHRLCDFVRDPLTNGNPVDVAQLVRKITVRVYDIDNPTAPKDEVVDGRGLHYLSRFINATQINIELRIGGAINGLDLTAQQMIKEVSGVVKMLIEKFEDKVWISTESIVSLKRTNIRPYWDSPAVEAVEKMRQGRVCSSEELMQIQVAKWTGVLGKVLDVNGDLVSLL